jgi:hypothetical protein
VAQERRSDTVSPGLLVGSGVLNLVNGLLQLIRFVKGDPSALWFAVAMIPPSAAIVVIGLRRIRARRAGRPVPACGYTPLEWRVMMVGMIPLAVATIRLVVVGPGFERGMGVVLLALLTLVVLFLVRSRRRHGGWTASGEVETP